MNATDVLVIGAGQAGLAAGYYLKQLGRPFTIVDADERIGDSWTKRWDSLHLFTPVRYSGLPGMAFPHPTGTDSYHLAAKDEVAAYFRSYAERFAITVRQGVKVRSVRREGTAFIATSATEAFTAKAVVIATGPHQVPQLPPFASELDESILQLHSSQYKNPGQLHDGPAMVVGVGNSGAQIAMELAGTRQTFLAGRTHGHLPRSIVNVDLYWWLYNSRLLTSPFIAAKRAHRPVRDPLIGISAKDMDCAGVQRIGRIGSVKGGHPRTVGGQSIEVQNVVWCTGFTQDFSWLELPGVVTGEQLRHRRGVIAAEPGLYFIGLQNQYRPNSALIGGAAADAKYVCQQIGRHIASAQMP